jgi:formamidopyrimidine-DNA glycosylase
MPELPEVETVRRGLEPALVGARIEAVTLRRPNLRFPFPERFADRIAGRTVTALARRAKYLLADLEPAGGAAAEVLVLHLGMSGRFTVAYPDGARHEPGDFYQTFAPAGLHDHVVFALSNGATVTYNDVRRFGFMDLVPRAGLETCRHFADLGIEPLGNALSGATIATLFRDKRTPLKAALLDQRLIAGLGNIYVCEALFRAGLHPEAPAGTLATATGRPREAAHRLATVIREVLTEAVAAGGSTLRDYAHTDGGAGAFQNVFRVYDRAGEPCTTPGCTATIGRLVQSGRSTFLCAACQPAGGA